MPEHLLDKPFCCTSYFLYQYRFLFIYQTSLFASQNAAKLLSTNDKLHLHHPTNHSSHLRRVTVHLHMIYIRVRCSRKCLLEHRCHDRSFGNLIDNECPAMLWWKTGCKFRF
ncbi:hypothetical protein O6P43_021637 [Quillaja saponaria]|uniref:Uncharacterized protein n=1 Tax=Quillaja saponaria TaxID=32244 RepID=A0AAD7LBC4_QUISA|nr:hypothetical protein O6P43_021637 [Quillaja saponaria]